MPRLNPGRALTSLVPESRTQRVYLLVTLINVYGLGLILTAMTLYAIRQRPVPAAVSRPARAFPVGQM